MSELSSVARGRFYQAVNATVILAALGYFVDIYDLLLFLIVGRSSLIDLKISGDLVSNFQYLLNVQMIGMLLGGILWGILGDKKGRLSVLFGSILTYSLANILNGFVYIFHGYEMEAYIILRFIAGIGLAGELGAGITLVSEVMSKETRGYGTMIVASVGVSGAVAAGIISQAGWQISYFIGGGLGICLLLLRIGVFESGIFKKVKESNVKMGSFNLLFSDPQRLFRYVYCVLIGLPVWFIIGILIGRAPEISKVLNVQGEVQPSVSVMLCYTGLILGDLVSGALSQLLKSRKKVLLIFYFLCLLFIILYLSLRGISATLFYSLIFCLGFSVGFWAIFVTVASENFGTNLRATVTTTVPNFVRGSLVLIAFLFDQVLKAFSGNERALVYAGFIVTLVTMLIAFWSLYKLPETFGKELDYLEDDKLIA